MVLVSCRRHSLAGCLLLALAAGSVAFLSADPGKKTPSDVDKVRKALDETVTLEVTDQPLTAALNQIREQTKINFVVDKLTIQQAGLDPDQVQVSAKLTDVKARAALRSLLCPHNLGYAVIGDTVLVSTDDMAMHRQVRQRVSVDLDKVDFADALKQIARDTGTSIVLDPRVAKEAHAKVTVELDDVPLETAVRLMAEGTGLKPVRVGNVLFVTSQANAVAMRNDAAADPTEGNPLDMIKDGFKDKAK
jgi:type II secretory pathway component GspD/PulD (secretin)